MDGVPYPTKEDRELVGAAHTAELPFVFADVEKLPLGMGKCKMSEGDRAVSGRMAGVWTGMADGRPGWEEFGCEEKGVYWDEGKGEVRELDFGGCEFWDGVWKAWGGFVVPRTCRHVTDHMR